MASVRNASSVASKWRDRLQASTDQMTQGVNSVTTAPGVQAAAQANLMKTRILEALNSGKWAKNVSKVTLQQWQQAMIQTGIPRVSQGASDKAHKVEAFMTKFLPFAANVAQQIAAMPNSTDQDRKNRMLKNFDLMKAFPGT